MYSRPRVNSQPPTSSCELPASRCVFSSHLVEEVGRLVPNVDDSQSPGLHRLLESGAALGHAVLELHPGAGLTKNERPRVHHVPAHYRLLLSVHPHLLEGGKTAKAAQRSVQIRSTFRANPLNVPCESAQMMIRIRINPGGHASSAC
eukprot:1178349-Prorocentrum_minimum.AAC.2